MAVEKAKSLTPSQRNTEAIIKHLEEYISMRFDQAIRINPELQTVKEDLIFHEMTNVRHCLNGDKIYGPVRHIVSDILLCDSRKRREGLMSSNDQTSIQVEIVSHCQDELVEATRGRIRFHDLKSFYAAINPALSDMLDLIESWIWWDIYDAATLVRFDQKMGVISTIGQKRFTPEMRKGYLAMLQAVMGEEDANIARMSETDILKYELKRLLEIRDRWSARRKGERGYTYILKRDELPAAEDQPEEEKELGPPYNFKERQLEQMDKSLQTLKQQLALLLQQKQEQQQ